MKTIPTLVSEGYNTISLLQEHLDIPLSTLQRMVKQMCDDGIIKKEGESKNTTYRVLRPTPTAMDILDKMRLIHQQKSMGHPYRKLSRDMKMDAVLNLYIDTFPGMVDDYNDEEHHSNITKAWSQLEKEI